MRDDFLNIKTGNWVFFFILVSVFFIMNYFGKYTDSTESLIKKEEDEVVDFTEMQIKEEDETREEMKEEEEDQLNKTLTEEESEVKLLTDEEIQAIAEEVVERETSMKKRDRPDILLKLLEHCINTILLGEMNLVGQKMNKFHRVLAEGVLRFAEMKEAENNRVKLERLVDSFRAAWKVWKTKDDKESVVDVFMKEMDNELWYPEELDR